jgi:hypothetical protein
VTEILMGFSLTHRLCNNKSANNKFLAEWNQTIILQDARGRMARSQNDGAVSADSAAWCTEIRHTQNIYRMAAGHHLRRSNRQNGIEIE